MDNTAVTNFNWSCIHTWKRSAKNTGWCLLGCAIGDFGTILFFQLTQIPFPILAIMTLAVINGLITSIILETIVLMKQNLDFSKALLPKYDCPDNKSSMEYLRELTYKGFSKKL